MSWFSNLLGTDGVVDGIKEGIDKSILTDEERLDYHKQMLKAYEPFKLIQRYLALAVTFMFSVVMFIEIGLVLAGAKWEKAIEIAMMINGLEVVSYVSYSFMSVMALYFSGGVLNTLKK